MAQVLVESISKTLRLPRPHLHEVNRAFALIEDWIQVVELVAAQPIAVKPLGYYRTPDDVDIYVFECVLGKNDADKKTWKIYRRYSHFQRYVAHSSELLSSMVVPKLSQAYMKIFSAKSCKDRLVELHAWLAGVIENTQTYCSQKSVFQDAMHDISSQEAVPAIILASFLLAGANLPFPHMFKGMPSFAFAMEEMNIQLTRAPVYPSKLRSSLETNAGLGLRLTASHEQEGKFIGAMVSGFLRDVTDLDKNLAMVNIGSKLVRINGVDVADEAFDKVLAHLRSAGMPLRLRFIYNPHIQRRTRGRSVYLKPNESLLGTSPTMSEKHRRRESAATTYQGSVDAFPSMMLTPESNNRSFAPLNRAPSSSASVSDPQKRFYSVDARKESATTMTGIFGSVFSDLFGRRRGESADQQLLLNNQVEEIFSWDDVGGEYQDIISRGFFSFISQAMLHELRVRRKMLTGDSLMDEDKPDEKEWRRLDQRRGQGIWSTSAGPMGFAIGACKLRGVEAAMLEIPPVFFSSRTGHIGSEKRLLKGFVLVSVNNESTFGMRFADIIKMLTKASRPTSICLRWFKDYSPFLETELSEQDTTLSDSRRRSSQRFDPASVFESSLDCLSEAHVDLCSNLHLALVENASIRNEIGTVQDTNRELRLQQEQAAKERAALEVQLHEQKDKIAHLLHEVADSKLDMNQLKQQLKASQDQLVSATTEQQKFLERAHANAVQKIAEHEERLVKESNKSIETAKLLAEHKMQKQLDASLNEMQRKHDEYLQKLAEEHSEEVESLSQQVMVWRHQVEVLTEAEKRNYTSMINNGTHPYHDLQRSRYGGGDPLSSFASTRTLKNYTNSASASGGQGATGVKSYAGGGGGTLGSRSNQREEDTSASPHWRDTTSPAGFKDHGSSEFSDRSSLSNSTSNQQGNDIWDRVVGLIG